MSSNFSDYFMLRYLLYLLYADFIKQTVLSNIVFYDIFVAKGLNTGMY